MYEMVTGATGPGQEQPGPPAEKCPGPIRVRANTDRSVGSLRVPPVWGRSQADAPADRDLLPRLSARWGRPPLVAGLRLLPADLIQPTHDCRVEGRGVPGNIQVRRDGGHPVVHSGSQGQGVELEQVAPALRVQEGRDRVGRNWQKPALDAARVGIQLAGDDDVDVG